MNANGSHGWLRLRSLAAKWRAAGLRPNGHAFSLLWGAGILLQFGWNRKQDNQSTIRGMKQMTLVLIVLSTGIFQTGSTNLHAQVAGSMPPSRDFGAQLKLFENYQKDFQQLEQSSKGTDFEELLFLEGVAAMAAERLYAAQTSSRVYSAIACEADRARVKKLYKDQLEYFAWQMDHEAARTTGSLSFAKIPAVAQLGLKMKDDLRATKDEIESVSASLN
jgi:hypothetical protein